MLFVLSARQPWNLSCALKSTTHTFHLRATLAVHTDWQHAQNSWRNFCRGAARLYKPYGTLCAVHCTWKCMNYILPLAFTTQDELCSALLSRRQQESFFFFFALHDNIISQSISEQCSATPMLHNEPSGNILRRALSRSMGQEVDIHESKNTPGGNKAFALSFKAE